MDPVRFSPGRAPYGSRILSARRQGVVPVLVQQGEGSHLAGRSHFGCRRENRAQGHTDLQPRSEGKGDQARAHLHERAREESQRAVQIRMTPVLALERVSCTFLSRDDRSERYTAAGDTTLAIGEG